MSVNLEKLKGLTKVEIPNSGGFVGYFDNRGGFEKLVAYAQEGSTTRFLWVHRDYQK